MPFELGKDQQQVIGQALQEAERGRLPWLDKLVSRAGYVRADFRGLQGKDIAPLWGVSPQAVSTWATKGQCPRDAKTRLYNLAEVIRWRETELTADGGAMYGPGSPALEAYRKAKAQLAQLDLKQRERDLLPRGPVFVCLERGAQIWRRSMEQVARKFPEAYAAILEGHEAFENEWRTALAGPKSDEEIHGNGQSNNTAKG